MASKRTSKGKSAAKAKQAQKKKAAAKGKLTPKKKPAPKAKPTPRSRALPNWEIQLRDNYLPDIQNRVNVIALELDSGDHNRGPVLVILEYLKNLLGELQSPSSNHDGQMLGYMERVLQIEPSISPDGGFQDIPDEPPDSDTYTEAMRDDFVNAWKLTWNIYARMDGTEQPNQPTAPYSDPAGQILDYAADILRCVNAMHPEFLALHQHKQSKS